MEKYEQEHLDQIRPFLAECMVLLKHNDSFPLEKPCRLALFGNGARHTVMGGTGSGEVNTRFRETVEDGLRKAGFTITTENWLNSYDALLPEKRKAFNKAARQEAKRNGQNSFLATMGVTMPEPEYDLPCHGEGEAAVYVLSRNSGEGMDRKPIKGDVLLTDTEINTINELQRTFEKFMLVLNVGGPVDLTPVLDVENILIMSQLGAESGTALADVLLGKTNPSGKLATTWTSWKDYPQIGSFGEKYDTEYKEGIYVGYRYFDTVGIRPLFPFGYGTSFTAFTLGKPKVSVKNRTVTVTCEIKNTGNRAGKETLQVYVSKPQGKLDQPYQVLAAFAKTAELQPGKKETVSCSFDMKDLASFDTENATMILENGDYIVRAGTSSANTTAAAVITLKKNMIIKQLHNKLNGKDVKDITPERKNTNEKYTAVKHFVVDEKAFQTETVTYSDDYETDPAVEALTDEQAALLNIGAFKEKGGIRSIIGSAASAVAGAAGETASGTPLPFMVMADGPAGLRLARDYYEDAEGAHSMSGAIPESMLEMMPAPVRLLMKLLVKGPKKGTEIKHQYCTAIPIGTAIAQTFNVEAAKTFGDIVGQEMERFHVQLWLAPALNIHRSILCGRNFEYFSEDPLISSCFAAALTKGVQSHPGCGVTLKHYAANNQETNRYSSNSIVSERALREIYLKGFEICIREADPKAVMTSYNLINGLHASENKDLINDILRCEFGFSGIVMTDWIIANFMVSKDSKYQLAQPWSIAAAGGDLLMPGSADEYHNTLEAVKTGKISRRQLDINATRIHRMAKELTGHNPH